MLPGGCGMLQPREGSQRHLGLTGTAWLWGQDRNLTGAQSHQHHHGQAASSQASHHLPPHPEQQNRHRERIPASMCHPRAMQSLSGQGECVREVTRGTGTLAAGSGLGTAPLAASCSQEEQRPWVGQVSMCSWLQSSWKGWSTTDTPEPAAKLQRGTRSDWHCPVPPVQG